MSERPFKPSVSQAGLNGSLLPLLCLLPDSPPSQYRGASHLTQDKNLRNKPVSVNGLCDPMWSTSALFWRSDSSPHCSLSPLLQPLLSVPRRMNTVPTLACSSQWCPHSFLSMRSATSSERVLWLSCKITILQSLQPLSLLFSFSPGVYM